MVLGLLVLKTLSGHELSMDSFVYGISFVTWVFINLNYCSQYLKSVCLTEGQAFDRNIVSIP